MQSWSPWSVCCIPHKHLLHCHHYKETSLIKSRSRSALIHSLRSLLPLPYKDRPFRSSIPTPHTQSTLPLAFHPSQSSCSVLLSMPRLKRSLACTTCLPVDVSLSLQVSVSDVCPPLAWLSGLLASGLFPSSPSHQGKSSGHILPQGWCSPIIPGHLGGLCWSAAMKFDTVAFAIKDWAAFYPSPTSNNENGYIISSLMVCNQVNV